MDLAINFKSKNKVISGKLIGLSDDKTSNGLGEHKNLPATKRT